MLRKSKKKLKNDWLFETGKDFPNEKFKSSNIRVCTSRKWPSLMCVIPNKDLHLYNIDKWMPI